MTVTAAELHAVTLALLAAIPTVTGYDADVPSTPPAETTTGRVYPYAVLWPSPGGEGPEPSVADLAGLDWTCQVTVAAGDVGWCLQAVGLVRTALDRAVLAPGVVLRDETSPLQKVRRDPDVSPPRWYVPLEFRALTP